MAGDSTTDTAEMCVKYAHLAYLWLPLFLGVTGGLCMLISTARKTLTAGTAAALASMSSVIVIATAAGYIATVHARAGRPAQMPEPQGLAGQHGMGFERAVQSHEQALEKLMVRIEAIERRLGGQPAHALPRPTDAPVPHAATPTAVPPVQGEER